MTLSKSQRATVREMFGGRCAYCGIILPEKWHADHVEAVYREWWKQTDWYQSAHGKQPPTMKNPHHDTIENLVPACPPCNIDKSAYPLEDWRQKLERGPDVLRDNYSTYRHSERFGIVAVVQTKVVFYFEKLAEGSTKS